MSEAFRQFEEHNKPVDLNEYGGKVIQDKEGNYVLASTGALLERKEHEGQQEFFVATGKDEGTLVTRTANGKHPVGL